MSPLAALITDWALTALWPIIGKDGTAYFSPALFCDAGLAIGLVALSPWLIAGGRWRVLFSRRVAFPLFMVGLLAGALASLALVTGVQYTTSANAAIMAQIEVIYSAVLCAILLRERIGFSQAAASLLVLMGTGLIMAKDLSTPRWKGDLLILLTPWMYQVAHIFAKRLPPDLDAVTIAGGRLFFGALCLLPFSVWTVALGPRWQWGVLPVLFLFAQGIGMSCLNHVLWYVAIRGMDLSKATAIMLSYPALTLLFSWGLGRESIHAFQLVGLALTLTGAYWISLLVLRMKGQPPPELFLEA